MRGLEGPRHLLRALEAGLAESCPSARSTWSSRAAPPPFISGNTDRAALRRSTPARELARGLPDAGTGIPHPCLDLRLVTGAGTGSLTRPHLAPRSRPQPGLGPGRSGGRSGP